MEFLAIYEAAIVYGGDRAWGNGAVYGNRNLRLSLPKRNLLPSHCRNTTVRGTHGSVLQSRNILVMWSHSRHQIRREIKEQHRALPGVARGGFSTHVDEERWDDLQQSAALKERTVLHADKCFQYSAAKPWLERSQCLLQETKCLTPWHEEESSCCAAFSVSCTEGWGCLELVH